MIESGKVYVTDVRNCARCKEDHSELNFIPFTRDAALADVSASHWAFCPTNGEPILLARVPRKKIERFWIRLCYAFSALRGR